MLPAVQDDHVQCPDCKHIGVDFYTKQLRSADEGQTVFYECPECGCGVTSQLNVLSLMLA
jgi:DNA-directed RNA polymerase subunit M/transcription elongation factor TFIIS